MFEQKLTKKQSEFLECFKKLAGEHNLYSPSLRELQIALGHKSVSATASLADAVVAKGFMRKEGKTARSLRLVNLDEKIAPAEAEKHVEWLRSEIERRKRSSEATEEIETLEEALRILDQSED